MPIRRHRSSLPLAAAALFVAALPAAALAQPDDLVARVDGIFASVDSTTTPGCVVGVSRAGANVLLRAYGMADLETGTPNTVESVFEAGSVSKQFTAAAVVRLAREGKLSLEDDVRTHLPSMHDQGEPVTLRRMLNHTSGLRDWGSVMALTGWPRGTRVYRQAHVLDVMSRQRGLNYRPGEEYVYSNGNYTIATGIVERVGGMPFPEFTRRAFFEPLGMARTSWRDDHRRVVPGRATAYSRGTDGAWQLDMPFENTYGHGGLLTTVPDLLRWSGGFDGRGLLDEGLVREMTTAGVLTDGRTMTYALGLDVAPRGDAPMVSHSGATAGYRAWLASYPADRLSVAVLCNAGNVNPVAMGVRVADLYLPPLSVSRPAPVAGTTLPRPVLASRAGLYRIERTGLPGRVMATDSGISINGTALAPVSPTRFRAANGGSEANYTLDANGSVVELVFTWADGSATRLLPAQPWSPSADELAALAGDYASDEADATFSIRVRDGRAELWRRPDDAYPLVAQYRDAFQAMGTPWFVVVHRDEAGRAVALGFTDARMRDVRFRRIP